VEAELRRGALVSDSLLSRMSSYQMGWVDAEGRPAQAGGKHVRSHLCCWAAVACGAPAEKALPAACAIELVHNFTLVHDDVQDRDTLRRGRPTVWAVWGEAQAINAGDYLFARACQALLAAGEPAPSAHAAAVVLDAVAEIIGGQCLDLRHECAPDTGLDGYLRIAEAKTGALFGASLEVGAIMAGAPADVRARLRRAGRLLGVLFQLRDDWLGIWGETALSGKSRQSDLERRKLTHPVAAAYELGTVDQRDRLLALYRSRGGEAEPEIRGILDELGVAELTANAASVRAFEAVAEIRRCGFDHVHVEEFAGVAGYLASRAG
jgi:geranylgeranyl diphosphate synthase type I